MIATTVEASAMLLNPMGPACLTGFLYYAAVFAFAFAMGVARVLVIAPQLGPTVAVLMEVPIVVVMSWIVARRLLRHQSFSLPARAAMGATAFALTIASEAALSVMMGGQGMVGWMIGLAEPAGLLGLIGQIVFGAMPMFIRRGRRAA